jgi:hypothetical protein
VKPGLDFATFANVIEGNGVHIYSHRSFEHDTDRTFEMELIGATKQLDVVFDRLRGRADVISITTE